MHALSRILTWLICSGILLAAPSSALAQDWLSDRERAEGPGFRLGDLEIHPGLGAEVGYDSNVFYSDANEADSPVLRITPHIYISTLGAERSEDAEADPDPPTIDFRFGAWGALYHFFSTSAQTNMEIGADLNLDILPERPFTLSLFDTLSRGIRPFTEAGATDNNYGRIRNDAGVRASFGPSGGVLRGSVGYTFGLNYFEGSSYQWANAFDHNINATTAWKFLPQTALLYDFQTIVSTYTSSDAAPSLRSDQVRIRNRIGVNGALTNNISALVMVGHAAGFYAAGDEYDDFIAQAELRFKLSETIRLSAGYDRDYQRSTLGNFFRRDRGYADLQVLVAGTVLVGIEGGVGYYEFGAALDAAGAPLGAGGVTERTDIRVDASLFAEWRIQNWLALNGTVMYDGDFTDFAFNRAVGGAAVIDPANYNKFQAWVGVRAFY